MKWILLAKIRLLVALSFPFACLIYGGLIVVFLFIFHLLIS